MRKPSENTDRITVKEAAAKVGMPDQTLRLFLQNGEFREFGSAAKTSNHWTYYINGKKLNDYLGKVKENN